MAINGAIRGNGRGTHLVNNGDGVTEETVARKPFLEDVGNGRIGGRIPFGGVSPKKNDGKRSNRLIGGRAEGRAFSRCTE